MGRAWPLVTRRTSGGPRLRQGLDTSASTSSSSVVMTFVRRSFLRLRAVLGRQKLNDEMQAEMREHLERATERLVARGMSPYDARLEARREFGNLTVIQDD